MAPGRQPRNGVRHWPSRGQKGGISGRPTHFKRREELQVPIAPPLPLPEEGAIERAGFDLKRTFRELRRCRRRRAAPSMECASGDLAAAMHECS
eukprot:620841-Pyramimonas_sp.AAC.1